MTVPLIGLGSNLALAALVPFVVEPHIPDGVVYAQRDYGLDLTIHERGAFCLAIWGVVDGIEGDEGLDALLTQMGLEDDSDQRSAVTVYLPTKRGKWHRYNGYAVIPQTIRYFLWPTDLQIMFNNLVQLG